MTTKQKNPIKSQQSALNNKQGAMFEDLILKGCEVYRQKGRASIEKTPEPFKVLSLSKTKQGQFTGQFQKHKKAQPDFKGVLNDGRAIIFEAKVSMDGRNRINQNRITDTQMKQLDEYEQMGAVAGVCVLINKTAAFIPLAVWKHMKQLFGRKYMTEEEAALFQVETFSAILFLNYIDQTTSTDFINEWSNRI
ncbi:Holliday junction resolvase RecU [Enterococcus sp. LJL128]